MAMIHVNRGATSLGAFSEEEVREGLRNGRFAPTDLGWREGMESWKSLSHFSELEAAVPAAPPPKIGATSLSETPIARSGLPWDQRQEKGFFNAFVETLLMVLGKPGVAFTAMKREGGLGEPLIYTVVGSSFGVVIYFLMTLFMPSLMTFGDRHGLARLAGLGIGSIFGVILVPFFAVIGTFIASAILHLFLMIVGGARQSFESTFRVVCFVVAVWKIILYCIGLARAHDTDTGRAVLAVILPVIVCCGGVIAVMFGALGVWSASHH